MARKGTKAKPSKCDKFYCIPKPEHRTDQPLIIAALYKDGGIVSWTPKGLVVNVAEKLEGDKDG